ncbi:uncharacterized protein LTHEOB_1228 [Neofusicoccum parvum]|uniref:Uncharacterized protein LTHEOB_1228 n=1 Tax=Neofusicoccum parvum TaxID=310453 RepID=A0ACB5SCV4_9PEZI|nr:uncharacterized protein LTHEOB_1228 [Neofusicoccum parvum]
MPNSSEDTQLVPFVPAFVEWTCARQSTTRYLGDRYPERACRVALCIRFDPPRHAASFKLRVPVSLKALGKRANLYLLLHPERVSHLELLNADDSAASSIPEPVRSTFVQNNQSSASAPGSIVGLRFQLKQPAAVVVPAVPSLAPGTKTSGHILELVESLANATAMTLYLPRQQQCDTSPPLVRQLERLGALVRDGRLGPIGGELDVASLYVGRGGEAIEGPDFGARRRGGGGVQDGGSACGGGRRYVPAESPPSYDELGPSPPPVPRPLKAPEKQWPSDDGACTGEEEVARSSSSSSSIRDELALLRKEILDEVRRETDGKLQQVEARLVERLEERLEEAGRTFDARMEERLGEHAQEMRREMEEQLDCVRQEAWDQDEDVKHELDEMMQCRLEEHLMIAKDELRDYVVEELKTVEDTIKRDISAAANVSIVFDE